MRIRPNSHFFALFFLARASLAAIYTNPLSVTGNTYDFIIVGGQSYIRTHERQRLIFMSMTS